MRGDEDYSGLDARANPNLFCIQVDNVVAASGYQFWFTDATASFSENCETSAVEDLLLEAEIKVFPNPAGRKFKVQSSKFRVEDAVIELYDLNGGKLFEKRIPHGSENIEIDVSRLQTGMYFCKISTDRKSITKKLIIQK